MDNNETIEFLEHVNMPQQIRLIIASANSGRGITLTPYGAKEVANYCIQLYGDMMDIGVMVGQQQLQIDSLTGDKEDAGSEVETEDSISQADTSNIEKGDVS